MGDEYFRHKPATTPSRETILEEPKSNKLDAVSSRQPSLSRQEFDVRHTKKWGNRFTRREPSRS
jgi:hypothetical protein